MPVRNALPFLDAAISSILEQSFADFELIIGDDGSTDGSSDRLRAWSARDPRIRLLHRNESGGPVGSSNWVADAARAPIVARMDADDIAHRHRLQRQIDIFYARPDIVLVGTLFEAIDAKGRLTRRSGTRAIDPGDAPPIAHGSIMYRKAAFDQAGGYAVGTDYFEDFDLYYRIAAVGKLIVLTEPLYRYRFSETSARLNIPIAQLQHAFDVQRAKQRVERHLPPLPTSASDLRPDTLRVVGSLRLWSGKRPGVLRQLMKSQALGWNLDAVKVVAWATWGAVSPGSLRACMRLAGRWRGRAARRRAGNASMVEWQPCVTGTNDGPSRAMKPGWSVVKGARAEHGGRPHSDGDVAAASRA